MVMSIYYIMVKVKAVVGWAASPFDDVSGAIYREGETFPVGGVELCNLTPHVIVLRVGDPELGDEGMEDIHIPPSGIVARKDTRMIDELPLGDGIPVSFNMDYGIKGVPEPIEGVYYIASSMVASEVKRPDVLSPNTSTGVIRDENGQVEAVTSLQRWVSV